jgi:hypothetical protein
VSVVPSDPVVRRAVWGTVAFAFVAAIGAAAGDGVTLFVVVFDLILFGLGCLAFLRTFFTAAERSRTEELSVAGIWFLVGAPRPIRFWLLGTFVVQLVVALVTAGIRPEPGAFGVLVPVYGLGLCGLWAVRSGSFPPRPAGRTN